MQTNWKRRLRRRTRRRGGARGKSDGRKGSGRLGGGKEASRRRWWSMSGATNVKAGQCEQMRIKHHPPSTLLSRTACTCDPARDPETQLKNREAKRSTQTQQVNESVNGCEVRAQRVVCGGRCCVV